MHIDHELADFAVSVLHVPNRTEAVDAALRLAVQQAARKELARLNAQSDMTVAELDAMREEGPQ
jgi:Arc/MetJ family transcription regulator